MQNNLPRHEVVLLGVGHTNAHVLRMWRMNKLPETRLTCISNFAVASYSGMLPGVLAGQYPPERMEIDLARLCAANGAKLIVDEVVGLDAENQQIQFRQTEAGGRPPLRYDLLSVGIGSVPSTTGLKERDELVMPIKPMQTFPTRLSQRLNDLREQNNTRPIRIVVVGGGAGGVEICLCLPIGLKSRHADLQFEITLVTRAEELLPGGYQKTQRRVRQILQERQVTVITQREVVKAIDHAATLDSGETIPADIVLWATHAVAPSLLREFNLPTDEKGFLQTLPTLQSTGNENVFAVGDSGTLAEHPTPKAGVYAVRQGPILWDNIGRSLRGETLHAYRPQKGFLKLLNTGNGRAIAEYHGFVKEGRWAWWLKDKIDGKFMDKYQNYTMPEMKSTAPEAAPVMRCVGCGGKVESTVLSRALARVKAPSNSEVLVGLAEADDVAVLAASDQPLLATTDFFAAPLDDPYLVGRIAVLNAGSDLFASGARPIAALATAELPLGSPQAQEDLLAEALAGASEELRRMGAALAGGHTIEGPRFTLGFTMLGRTEKLKAKADLREGDRLVCTKPLGSGVLLAALAEAACKGEWRESLLREMLIPNQTAAELFAKFDVSGMTDVTGFGLAGHLLEMLRGDQWTAEVDLAKIELLPGAGELFAAGRESTLAPGNRAAEAQMTSSRQLQTDPRYQALFDPQTCGGLLAGVASSQVANVLAELREAGLTAYEIGAIAPRSGRSAIELIDSSASN